MRDSGWPEHGPADGAPDERAADSGRATVRPVSVLLGQLSSPKSREYASAQKPLVSAVPPDDPAIDYLRHASWPPLAALQFIKLQFPQAVFWVAREGAIEIISPGSPDEGAFDALGLNTERDRRYVRVCRDLDYVGTAALTYCGPAGWAKDSVKSNADDPPIVGASEATIIAAADSNAAPCYIYVFVPEESSSPFEPDPFLPGIFRTQRSFEPLLVVKAQPREVCPELYLLPDFSNKRHPYHLGNILNTLDKNAAYTGQQPKHINGVPLNRLTAREFEAIRREHAAMDAEIDRRHAYTAGSATEHRMGVIMLELDGTVWLVQDPDDEGTCGLPKQRIENGESRSQIAADAAYRQLGLAGPTLAFHEDIEDGRSTTRYNIKRRHAGAPLETVKRVSINEAISMVRDPADVMALRSLQNKLNPPDWWTQAQIDEAELVTQPGALEDYESGGVTHSYSKLTVGVHRVCRVQKIAREPHVFRGKITVDGRDVFYTGRRIETYVSLPGKPAIKMTALEFELDDVGPTTKSKPTFIIQGGGPGASPAFFLAGGLGPIRIDKDGNLRSNDDTLLVGARLIFLDAPATGHAFTDGQERAYFNLEGDAAVHAEWVIRYYQENRSRLKDTLFFPFGTSYGAQRWGRAIELLIDAGVPVGGLILVSGAMSRQLTDFDSDSLIPYACALASYAAIARYHLPQMREQYPDQEKLIAEVKEFAFNVYLPAITQGIDFERDRADEFKEIARRLSQYIGIPTQAIEDKHLKIAPMDFCTMLIPGETIAALDGRMRTKPVPEDAGSDPFAYVLEEMTATCQKTLTGYFRDDVGYRPIEDPNGPYVVLDPSVKIWGWGDHNHSAPRIQDRLVRILTENPQLEVLVVSGIFDAKGEVNEHAIRHFPPDVARRIEIKYYDGGHMFYATDEPESKRFIGDLLTLTEPENHMRA